MSSILDEYIDLDSQGVKRTFVKFRCDNCKQESSKVKKNFGIKNFCCHRCSIEHRKRRVSLVCSFCGGSFERNESQLKNSKHGIYFCSRSCKDEGQKIKNGITDIHPDHYGANNYRRDALDYYPNRCNRCGYNKFIGSLHVHHKDGDHNNNELSNLEIVCANCHGEIHWASNQKLS